MSETDPTIGAVNTIDKTLAIGRDRNGTDVVRGDSVLYVRNGLAMVAVADYSYLRDGANVELLETDAQITEYAAQLNFVEVASTEGDHLNFITREGEAAEFTLADNNNGVMVRGVINWASEQGHDTLKLEVPRGGTVVIPGSGGNYITHVEATNEVVVTVLDEEGLDYESSGSNHIERVHSIEDAVRQIQLDFPWLREDLLYSQEDGETTLNAYILDVVSDIDRHGLSLIDTRRMQNLSRRSGSAINGPLIGERYYLACLDYVRLCQLAIAMEIEYDDNFQSEVFTLLADMENAASDRVNLMNQFINQRYPQFADRERYYKTNRFFLPLEGRRDRAGYHLNDHIGVDISVTGLYDTEQEAFDGLVAIDNHERNHLGMMERRALWGNEDTYEEVLSAEMLTILTDAIVEGPDGLVIDLSIVTSDDYRPAFNSLYTRSVLSILHWVQRAVDEQDANYDNLIGSLIFTAKTGILYAGRHLYSHLDDISIDNGYVVSASRGWKHFPLYNVLSRYYDPIWLDDTLRETMSDKAMDGRKRKKRSKPQPETRSDKELLDEAINHRLQTLLAPAN